MKPGRKVTFRYKNKCRVSGRIVSRHGRILTVILNESLVDENGKIYYAEQSKIFNFQDISDIYVAKEKKED